MTSLYLIDGHNVLYRTFYGLPRLTAPDGTPTNVVLGTSRILLKILREENPHALAAVFDSPGPTQRHNLFPEYKANRLKVPEELLAQIPMVKEVIDALGVPRIEVPGAEADDIIGTLSRLAEEKGMDVIIVSSDKDLYQLVSKQVRIQDGLKEKTVGEEEVRDTFGVGPGQVADLLALAGDPSDNIPGVPGIGEKTASGLIREFGTVENLLAQTDKLKGKQREKIEKNAEMARLCRQLAVIDRNLPLSRDIGQLTPGKMRRDKVAALFRKLGFRKLLEELDIPPAALPFSDSGKTRPREGIRTNGAGDLFRAIGHDASVRVGIADSGEKGEEIAAAVAGQGIWLLPGHTVTELIRRIAESGGSVYLYDGKAFLRDHGDVSSPGWEQALFDLQVAAYLLAPEEGTPNLSKLRERFLPGREGSGEGAVDPAALAEDIVLLGEVLEGKLSEAGLAGIFREVDMPLLPVLFRMETKGIRIDVGIFRELSEELAEGTRGIEEKVAEIAGPEVNINSPKQLSFLSIREAWPSAGQEDEDGLLDGRGGAGAAEGSARDSRPRSRIPDACENTVHLRQCPSRDGGCAGRAHPHDIPPDANRNGPPFLLRSQPAEHPGARRPGKEDPVGVRGRSGVPLRRRRLLPGGAAASCASFGGRRTHAKVPGRGGHPRRDRMRCLRCGA